ncbi:MAG: [FeFe] hydrogenase, group A [Gracilibacteraceae bacterium]|jgi:NADP-reducing hydrogenase subunit HndD|nr:[FeFe] hydrogenase, group A [Gracilibacteraceae bacterium]
MSEVNLTINGRGVSVPADYTVLMAAKKLNVNIPTLCYLKDVNQIGACRMCLVEVKGGRGLSASCVLPVTEGMEVWTNTPLLRETRRGILELILSNHNRECTSCIRSQNCELQRLTKELGVTDSPYERAEGEGGGFAPADEKSLSIARDPGKCILCRRCVAVCHDVQGVGVIQAMGRGYNTVVGTAFDLSLADVACINCGQCIQACPVGALKTKDDTDKVWAAIGDPAKHVVFQVAPSVRFGLGEEFGVPAGGIVTRQMAEAIKLLGVDKVFDANFAADLTIMEEGTELIGRLQNGGVTPMITSCSPGWIKYCETYYPEFLPNLSSCKSPMGMMGAVIKTYYAENAGVAPEDIYSVAVMPCTAKKFEAARPEMSVGALRGVDAVITTRELARMIKEARIDFLELAGADFDELIGEGSGAGTIFGATGGVAEAALRTAADILTGQDLREIDYTAVRGVKGIKEAVIPIGDLNVRLAVVSGTGNAGKLLERIKAGEADYDFIEIMACPGGCVTGGGQPIRSSDEKYKKDFRAARATALYQDDVEHEIRKSHQNPLITKIYADYLEKPNSHRAHELLHTHYTERELYPANI